MTAALLSVIHIDLDPVPITIGPVSIHWYGILYAVAFVVAYRFGVVPHLTRRGVPQAVSDRHVVSVIIAGLVGARLYYVIQQPNLGDYMSHPLQIIAVWNGGMAFFGAIIASLLAIAFIAWRAHLPFWLLADAGAFFAVVGQPIGRLGNLINGDILGSASNLPWATAYENPHAVLQNGFLLGQAYQPAALYEALGAIAIGGLLFWLRRRGVRVGVVIITYVAAYAVAQFLLFFLRASEPAIGLGLKQAQWTALAVLLLAVPALVVVWRRTEGRHPTLLPLAPSDGSEDGGSAEAGVSGNAEQTAQSPAAVESPAQAGSQTAGEG